MITWSLEVFMSCILFRILMSSFLYLKLNLNIQNFQHFHLAVVNTKSCNMVWLILIAVVFVHIRTFLFVFDALYKFHSILQTSDGSNAVVIGSLGNIDSSMVIVGGNCSIQGYDQDGNENFWTVRCNILMFFKMFSTKMKD